jgi:mannose-6-phosphate isomerase-like protein (cupin superfamily)
VEVVNRDRSVPFITKDGAEIRSVPDRTNWTVANQSLAEATLPPGAGTEEHHHPGTEEIYYVLRGQGLTTLENEGREVGQGDGVLIPSGNRQRIRNLGSDPLVFLCCCSPPYSPQDTILASGER